MRRISSGGEGKKDGDMGKSRKANLNTFQRQKVNSIILVLQENMMQDLTAVRELCMKLDQTRESLSRQLTAKSLDHDQVRLRFACPIL